MSDQKEQQSLEDQLYWAQRHAEDLTMAVHNRHWFAEEAKRLRAEIAKERSKSE